MAITSTTAKASYAGNGSATEFPTTFKFLNDEHVVCVLTNTDGEDTTLELDTDYSVSGAGDDEGGTVTFPAESSEYSTLASGETLTIYRDVPLTQETDWENSDEIDVEEIEAADDKLTMICQQLDAKVSRAIKVPVSSSLTDVECESPEAGKALIWNDAGTGIINGSIDASTLSATTRREEFTAEDGQTLFTLSTFTYTPSADNLAVYVDGLRLDSSEYEKTSTSSFTLAAGATEGAVVAAVSVDISAMADMNAATDAAEAAQDAAETAQRLAEDAQTAAEAAQAEAEAQASAAAGSASESKDSEDAAAASALAAANSAAVLNLPTGDSGNDGDVLVFDYAGGGYDLYSPADVIEIAVNVLRIGAPDITSPTDGATGILDTPTPTFALSAPSIQLNGYTLSGMQLQLDAAAGDFSDPVYNSGWLGAVQETTLAADILLVSTSYMARARYKVEDSDGVEHVGEWSEVVTFTTAAEFIYVTQPVNSSPADEATDVEEQPTLIGSTFAVTGGSDTQTGAQFRVLLAADGSVVWDSGALGAVESVTVDAGYLTESEAYTWQCRYQGTELGWSDWSAATGFTCEDVFSAVTRWGNWDDFYESTLAASKIFTVVFNNVSDGGDEVGQGGGLSEAGRTLTQSGNIAGSTTSPPGRVVSKSSGFSQDIENGIASLIQGQDEFCVVVKCADSDVSSTSRPVSLGGFGLLYGYSTGHTYASASLTVGNSGTTSLIDDEGNSISTGETLEPLSNDQTVWWIVQYKNSVVRLGYSTTSRPVSWDDIPDGQKFEFTCTAFASQLETTNETLVGGGGTYYEFKGIMHYLVVSRQALFE
jgi:hypothetical protein